MNPTLDNPRLTTKRVDGFTPHEEGVLREAGERGIVWLIHGKTHSDLFLAAYSLQRLGYLWPTQQGKPEERSGEFVSGSFGWKIEPEGRAALAILDRGVAA